MGLTSSTNYNSPPPEPQDPEDDEFICCGNKEYASDAELRNLPFQQDIQLNQQLNHQNTPQLLITEQDIMKLETQLDFFEKVSLVYLLYEDPIITFKRLQDYLEYPQQMVLLEWYTMSVGTDNWQNKLCEGLALIQNYLILEELGYEQSQVQERFLTFNEKTSMIDEIKRKLYSICESLNDDQFNKLLFKVKFDFLKKNLEFKEFFNNHLEFYLAYWTKIEYITFADLNNLQIALGAIEDPPNFALKLKPSTSDSRFDDYCNNEFFTTKDQIQNDKCYHIESKYPGICLIINQEYFNRDPTKTWETLAVRKGTERDCNKLHETFKKFGFTVIIRNNRTNDQMEEDIKDAAEKATNHSSLFICILSHGIEGAVYAANNIRVEIRDICNLMCRTNKHLKDKPKILILQSCQGRNLYPLTTDSDGANDELIQNNMYGCSLLQARDMMVFRATVPGYSSLRCPVEGSWFIQCLCDTLLKEAFWEHFLDICVIVQDNISNKSSATRKGLIGMIPVIETTLRKKMYLPRLKNMESS